MGAMKSKIPYFCNPLGKMTWKGAKLLTVIPGTGASQGENKLAKTYSSLAQLVRASDC
jgi:hypothetical protein